MRAARLLAPLALLLASCITTEEVERPPAVNVTEGGLPPAPAAGGPGGSLGIEVEANEGDSLERLEVLPGARVASVAPGGPAARAGIQAGDVILSLEGAPLSGKDSFQALERASAPGKTVKLEARRGTLVFQASAVAAATAPDAPPVELYRADPVKLRAGFTTVAMETKDGGRRSAAELVKVFPGSPLAAAEVHPGARILSLEGKDVASAQELVRRVIEEHEHGERVRLRVLGMDGRERDVRVALWAPERSITRLGIPILFRYERSLSPRKARWIVLNLGILSLFDLKKEGGETEVGVLGIRFRRGHGDLVEEPPPEGGAR